MNGLLVTISSSVFSAAVIVAIINFFKDRRTNKAKGTIAERTVEMQVDAASLVNMDKRLSLVERAHDAERDALHDTIGNLQLRLDQALQRVLVLEQRAEFEDNRYRAAVRYIRQLRAWISNRVPGADPPPVPTTLEADFED